MSSTAIDPRLRLILAVTIVVYVVVMYALSFWVRRRVHDTEDFLVAGRRLPLSLAWMTLLATWFGAGTLLTAADEVRHRGLRAAALDPLGAGLCLLLAGAFLAAPLWRMGLLTVGDFFRRRFGPVSEVVSSLILVPGYFGWVAAQFTALAGMLTLFFDLPPALGAVLVAAVGVGYTLLGGMWSVTLTDAVQISLVLAGLAVLAGSVLSGLGGGSPAAGLGRLLAETPPEMLVPVPTESRRALLEWLAVLGVGCLGNLPGQDLLQRIFAARSARVARRACLLAGALYLVVGLAPVGLGLAANLLFPDEIGRAIVPALAHLFLSPAMTVIFTVALMSAVLSTIDSAILSPAGVLAQNVLAKVVRGRISSLALNRWAVVGVGAASLALALSGKGAYELLEAAYEISLVALFAPLVVGLYTRRGGEGTAVASMLVGALIWGAYLVNDWRLLPAPLPLPDLGPWPPSMVAAGASLALFCGGQLLSRRRLESARG